MAERLCEDGERLRRVTESVIVRGVCILLIGTYKYLLVIFIWVMLNIELLSNWSFVLTRTILLPILGYHSPY